MQLRNCARKGMMWFLGLFQIILLFMKLILLVVNFCRTVRVASVILLFMPYFLVFD
jgi:hypothetical protein